MGLGDLLQLAKVVSGVFDFEVELLDLVLVHFLGALLHMQIAHSLFIVFFQNLKLIFNLVLLLLQLFFPLDQLGWLLLQLGEDH